MKTAEEKPDNRDDIAPFMKPISLFTRSAKSLEGPSQQNVKAMVNNMSCELSTASEDYKKAFPGENDLASMVWDPLVALYDKILHQRSDAYLKDVRSIIATIDEGLKKVPRTITSLSPQDLKTFNDEMNKLGEEFVTAANTAGDMLSSILKDAEAISLKEIGIIPCFEEPRYN